ncbi:hypothetical protein OPV22_017104 [Ensete ventricosum]|uniref:CASP-like protein n=1 Tax=Ensete ventricosum TaxID=4639 RepID=A0AAV8R1C1_ENSVE|nr:hypothetical protein OPV22_017104 [Ensete ventricosum]
MNAASTDSSEPGPGELVPAAPSVELEKTSSGAQIPAPAERTDGGRSTAPRSRSVLRKSRTDNFLERGALLLRAFACLFSLIALAVLASNKHGDWQDFDRYQEYRYLLAIAVLAFIYSMAQILRQVNRSRTGKDFVAAQYSWIVDFAGDQVMAYLLMSSSSAAIPITNHMREAVINMFTDASAASIGMAFLAFVALALSALISGFKVSKQNYI